MANPWFRLYAEIVDDWKIKSLAFEDRWHYVALLALKCAGELDKPMAAEQRLRMLTIKLGVNGIDLENLLKRLVEAGLLTSDVQPKGWDERQFQSDSSTDRVRAYRARRTGNGDETLQQRSGNGAVTAQDTDTDTDTESEGKKKTARTKARAVDRPPQVDEQVWSDFQAHRKAMRAPLTATALVGIEREAGVAGLSLNDALRTCCERGWRGFKADWIREGRAVDSAAARRHEGIVRAMGEFANGN